MDLKKIKPKKITSFNFRKFGWVIDLPDRNKKPKNINLFRIVVRQSGPGWRIAYLVVRDAFISKLEQHPDSLESFEPVSGRGLIYLTRKKDSRSIECFFLDRPVILKKGIWHGVLKTGGDFDVKITENSKVKCVYWKI